MKLPILFVCLSLGACTISEHTQLPSRSQIDDASQAMVVTANPHASRAGAQIIRAGGSAVDAAIAIEAVLSLVEPQSSGLGGGGFMTYYDNRTKTVSVYDGRETAPASATPELFIKHNGEPYGFIDAKNSGLSIGVPGIVSMLQLAHEDHGKLPWSANFDYAKTLAIEGFPVSPRLHSFIQRFAKYIPSTIEQGPVDAYHYFYGAQGKPHPVGYLLKNSAYANTLELIANDPRAFYTGTIADQIVEQANALPRASGMQKTDLVNYSARREPALCAPFRSMTLCGPPPPSSWLMVAMIMGVLERLPASSSSGAHDPDNWLYFAESQRLAYADRDQYVADPDFVDVPIQGMLHPSYLDERANLISRDTMNAELSWGDPWAYQQELLSNEQTGLDSSYDAAGTTHFVVVDLAGNVVSMTASVESVFGSTRMAGGLFLNNQLTDFSFKSMDDDGHKIANSVAAGKRPRSSMSPTIVLDQDGEFLMASGSPGGSSIIAYTAKTLVGVLEWGLTPQQSIELPNLVARSEKVRIEKARASNMLIKAMADYGYSVTESAGENSGLSVVFKDKQGRLLGGVDPRREGVIEIMTQ